jgi:D-lyxose ketol-isomerase
MKRSEINAAIALAIDEFRRNRITLPPFAHWSPLHWREMVEKAQRIVQAGLGWDVTDFGQGKYDELGGVLFTARNGVLSKDGGSVERGVPYCEKYIVLTEGQRMPLHLHWSKTEDIINRAGGILVMELYNSVGEDEVDVESDVTVVCDGLERSVGPGECFELHPGESITLDSKMYHRFWAKEGDGTLICGEVSTVNDDSSDNGFAEPSSRYSEIVEDEEPRWLLCNEYGRIGR